MIPDGAAEAAAAPLHSPAYCVVCILTCFVRQISDWAEAGDYQHRVGCRSLGPNHLHLELGFCNLYVCTVGYLAIGPPALPSPFPLLPSRRPAGECVIRNQKKGRGGDRRCRTPRPDRRLRRACGALVGNTNEISRFGSRSYCLRRVDPSLLFRCFLARKPLAACRLPHFRILSIGAVTLVYALCTGQHRMGDLIGEFDSLTPSYFPGRTALGRVVGR